MSSHSRRAPTTRRRFPPLPPKGSRWRLWLTLAAVSVGWKVLVFTVGAALPRWLINDGIEQLPTALQDYGREAKRTALALWDGPFERHGLVRTVRVVSVHGRNGEPLSPAVPAAGATTTYAAALPNENGPAAAGAADAELPNVGAAVASVLPAASVASVASGVPCDGHGAVVRAYTYFGIPYSEARTRCDSGVVEYRVFRRRKQQRQATP